MHDQLDLRATLESALADCCPGMVFVARESLMAQGLGSLAATRFVLEVEARLGLVVPMADLGRGLSLDDLVVRIGAAPGTIAPVPAPTAAGMADDIPLLPLQLAYLVTSDPGQVPDPAGCHIYREIEFHGVAESAIVSAWDRLVEHHQLLRARVGESGALSIGPKVSIETITAPGAGHDAAVCARRAEWESRTDRVPDALVAAAVVVSPGRATVHLSIDGLVVDGHGLGLLLEQWPALAHDPGAPLETSPLTVAECVARLSRPYSSADLAYWRDIVKRAPGGPFADHVAAALSARRDHADAARPVRRRPVEARLSTEEWTRCRARAAGLAVSASSLVFAVFSEAVLEAAGTPSATFVLTTSERPRLPAGVGALIGQFTSSMVVPVETDPGEPIEAFCVRVHQETWRHLEHGAAAVSAVGKGLPVVFTSLLGIGGLPPRASYAVSQTSGIALDHQMWEEDGELVIHWDIADALLPPFVADVCLARLVSRLRALGAASRPGNALNPLQRAYLVSRAMGAVADGCCAVFSLALDRVDPEAVAAAWRDVVQAHDALRAVVDADGTVRTLDPSLRPQVGVTRVEAERLDERRAHLDHALAQRAYPLGRWPLHDVHVLATPTGGTVHLVFDLIALDGASIHRVVGLLAGKLAGTATPRPARPTVAASVVVDAAEHNRYWAAKSASLCPGPEVRIADGGPREWTRLSRRIAGFDAFAAACRRLAVPPDAVLITALAHALYPEVQRPFALPVVWWRPEDDALRPAELSQMAWVVHDQPDDGGGEARLGAAAREVARAVERDLAHGGIEGLEHIGARFRRARTAADPRPFALPVVYTGLVEWDPLPSAVAASLRWQTMTPDVSLDAVALALDDTLVLAWDMVEADFPPAFAARAFDRYAALVERMVRDPVRVLGINDRERRKVLYDWNNTRRPFRADGPIHLAFEGAAAARPEEIAVRWRGGAWTFGRLNAHANRIARRLRALGVEAERKVSISIDRGPHMIAATLGVLKAGGVYVPVEPSQPGERAARMLRISDARIVLSSSATVAWALPAGSVRVDVDTLPVDPREAENPSASCGADSTAYIIFTSGSTGEPKGVAVAHRALHNLFQWCHRRYGFGAGDVGLCVTSLGFDLSVFDILGLLGYGAGIYVADAEEQRDPSLLAEALITQPITFWNSAPTTLVHLRPYFADLAGKPEAQRVRLVFLSGDYTPLSLPPEVFATFPNARLVSLGGATEATVWSNFHDVVAVGPRWHSIPYGRPIDNARYYILDERREPCPVGVEGDLYIAGEVLSLGYYDRPELTAERFVRDPFVLDPAARMYWTGDRAVFFEDGVIGFRGRADTQVKIRGFRVELQEIEHALIQHPAISDAVVIARPDASGDPKLVAYVQTDAPVDVAAARALAAATLPSYMVPNVMHGMTRFPATENGKLDRNALPWPLAVAGPGTSLEALVDEIHSLFQRFLGAAVDPDADVWNHGATSFTITQVGAALRASRGVRMSVAALVADPTIRGMASRVLASLGPPSADPRTERAGGEPVDVLNRAAKEAFLHAGVNRRADLDPATRVSLPIPELPAEWRSWRGAQRSFRAEPVTLGQLAALLGLLAPATVEGRPRYLFPSAGDTYCVQTYLWIRGGRVTGLDPGYYWLDAAAGALLRTGSTEVLDRSAQFVYNRPLFDAAAAVLFLVGEHRGIEPLYGEEARRFLLLEAGYMGQLLMLGQRNAELGLCPIGTFDVRPVAAALGLGDRQEVLHSFLVGRVQHDAGRAGVLPPLSIDVRQPPGPAVGAARVAIVGQAGRYPGAESPEALWMLLRAGKSALRPAPRRRGLDGAATSLTGGFLDDIESFDPMTFSIAPTEAGSIDPQARLLLEVTWECLERAGHSAASLQRGERTGVFVGHLWQDYGHMDAVGLEGEPSRIAAAGSELANRISHAFGFTGPSIAVDTSCCSALTALHLAVSAIQRGECDSAVVCAVNLLAHPHHAQVLRGLGLVAEHAPRGAYDQGTPGWAVGEGAGALLLRRTTAHGADGDTVIAVVEATHTEHIGGRGPYGAPSSHALAAALRATIAGAGLEPDDIDYVECAASGAAISDGAEWQALADVFPAGVQVGTLKPNIGHLEAASGLSQVAKALLQLEHGELLPTRVAPEVSPFIDLTAGPLRIVRTPTPFRATGRPRRIIVNAVGATGSLAQVILASPSPMASAAVPASGPSILLLSAASKQQLDELAALYGAALDGCLDSEWLDICATTQRSRASRRFRLAVDAPGRPAAIEGLRSFLAGRPSARLRRAEADPTLAHGWSTAADARRATEDWLAGYEVDWAPFWTGVPRRRRLPTYPFARLRSWAGESSAPAARDAERWEEVVRGSYSRASGIPATDLDPHVPLGRYGLCSRIATQVAAELNRHLGSRTLPATLLYEHRDLASVAGALSAVTSVENVPDKRDPSVRRQPIAIIGLAGRYPGAADVDTLWRHLLSGDDLVAGPPADRVELDRSSGLLRGGFLADVASFDPFLFGVTPDDAARMDPEQRLFLEVVWEALEDACWPPVRLRTELSGRVGVFAGIMHNEYPLIGAELSTPERRVDAGATPAGVANRISYHLDLTGPSLTVDTMCSSSLAAMHLAVETLRAGRIELAIVGGVNLSLHPNKFVQQARLGMTSSADRCRSFGAGGDGFVPGEGVGVVILRRLDDAEAADDRVHAVVRGTAMNHGGKVNGFTVPNPRAQSSVIKEALADAGVAADTISYVEAHGTGTALGDPIETRALGEALGLGTIGEPLAIGSIKSNVGHLEAAAGIAGVTKVLLQMRHRTLVPSLHAEDGNPEIDWTLLRVPRSPEIWRPRREAGREVWRAAVSSFGAGGVNVHVVLEAAGRVEAAAIEDRDPQLLVLSAATPEALIASARRLADFLAEPTGPALSDVAGTLQSGREPLRERWAAVCRDRADAVRQARVFADGGQAGHRGRARPGSPAMAADADLAAVAERWVVGGAVDWAARYPRRCRMVGLPSYPFTRLRCWIDPERHGIAVDPPSTARSPAAVSERVWRHDASADVVVDESSIPPVVCLVTPATERLARDLASRLGSDKVLVTAAASGSRVPAEARAMVLLGDLDPSTGEDGWRGPFEACRTSVRQSPVTRLHVLQVVSGLHEPSRDAPPHAGARLAGLLHCLAAERSQITTTVLDVGPVDFEDPGSRAACVDAIVLELARRAGGDVCVTRLGRLVPVWEPARREAEHAEWAPRGDALYLVTGGTRGIGARLARTLVHRGSRRMALVGRRRSAASDDTIRNLREGGAVVEVHYGPVEDREALDSWLRSVEARLGPLAGVFHCAGLASAHVGSLLDVGLDEIAAVAAPKVGGLEALLPAIRRCRPEVAVAFSSISAAVPGVSLGVGDYAAANSAMEYVADQLRGRGCPTLRTIGWPVWASSTADEAARASMRRHGLAILSDAEAFDVLWSVAHVPGSGRLAVADARVLREHAVAQGSPPRAGSGPNGADWLVELISGRIGMSAERLDRAATFGELGIESVTLAQLVQDIEAHVGRPVGPSLLIEHPTVDRLAVALGAAGSPIVAPNPRTTTIVSPHPPDDRDRSGGVAIVGMSIRFPGAPSTAAFWDLLSRGACAVGDIPRGRWDIAALFDPEGRLGTSISRWGGFLDGIEDFDPEWFRMSEAEARCLDPAIRLFLEGTEAGLRDHGRPVETLGQGRTGVFVGGRLGDYRLRVGVTGSAAGLGGDQNFIAARVAHHFDLRGPNLVVDTACSSALTAVHLACQSLRSGECDVAIAGGVDVLLDEAAFVQFTAARALSPSGRCRTFDKAADGFVPGEGCGVFVLKRLQEALRDGDRILAVVEGSAVNNDGRTMGLTTPNPDAQRDVVTGALTRAGRQAREIGLVEAHGTATVIGDPIELRALAAVFERDTHARAFCGIGSVKSNIGHLLGAAGAAGLAKAVLAVQHGAIPATLFCETPNPRFDLARSPFFIPSTTCGWRTEGRRVAGVSAFGLGGTNAHVVVSQAPAHTPGRPPLPAPQFRRCRLWFDRPRADAPPIPDETLSLLDLTFVDAEPAR